MSPVASYIKVDQLNKRTINIVLIKINRSKYLDKTIKDIKHDLQIL